MVNFLSYIDPVRCSITEWDGTVSTVEAILWGEDEVRIRYEDGLVHAISVAYFKSVFLEVKQSAFLVLKPYLH